MPELEEFDYYEPNYGLSLPEPMRQKYRCFSSSAMEKHDARVIADYLDRLADSYTLLLDSNALHMEALRLRQGVEDA